MTTIAAIIIAALCLGVAYFIVRGMFEEVNLSTPDEPEHDDAWRPLTDASRRYEAERRSALNAKPMTLDEWLAKRDSTETPESRHL